MNTVTQNERQPVFKEHNNDSCAWTPNSGFFLIVIVIVIVTAMVIAVVVIITVEYEYG